MYFRINLPKCRPSIKTLLTIILSMTSLSGIYNMRQAWKNSYTEEIQDLGCQFTQLKSRKQLFDYFDESKADCHVPYLVGIKRKEMMPEHGIPLGSKWVCLSRIDREGNCIVYSFGINNGFTFENQMANYGCKVFAFDPTLNVAEHKRMKSVKFYKLKLGDFTGHDEIDGRRSKVDQLQNIYERLGHMDNRIDYLKLNINGYDDVKALENIHVSSPDLIADYVRQIGIEIQFKGSKENLPFSEFEKVWRILQSLECLGFRLSKVNMNAKKSDHYMYEGERVSKYYELLFVNEFIE